MLGTLFWWFAIVPVLVAVAVSPIVGILFLVVGISTKMETRRNRLNRDKPYPITDAPRLVSSPLGQPPAH